MSRDLYSVKHILSSSSRQENNLAIALTSKTDRQKIWLALKIAPLSHPKSFLHQHLAKVKVQKYSYDDNCNKMIYNIVLRIYPNSERRKNNKL